MSYALGMVRNTATGRFHPMFYRDAPFPGGVDSDLNRNVARFKSGGHHTNGFATREEADSANEESRERLIEAGEKCWPGLISDWEWDGQGCPSDIRLVNTADGVVLPSLRGEVLS